MHQAQALHHGLRLLLAHGVVGVHAIGTELARQGALQVGLVNVVVKAARAMEFRRMNDTLDVTAALRVLNPGSQVLPGVAGQLVGRPPRPIVRDALPRREEHFHLGHQQVVVLEVVRNVLVPGSRRGHVVGGVHKVALRVLAGFVVELAAAHVERYGEGVGILLTQCLHLDI